MYTASPLPRAEVRASLSPPGSGGTIIAEIAGDRSPTALPLNPLGALGSTRVKAPL